MVRDFGHEDAGNASVDSLARIVHTDQVQAFLGSNSKRYVVGPKGSGKTLILLRKAIDQRDDRSCICIPSDPHRPVDRLDAAEHLGQRFFHKVGGDSQTEQHLAWTAVWKHAILSSVLHHLAQEVLERLPQETQRRRLAELVKLDSPFPLRPFHYYRDVTHRLDSAPRDVLARIRDDLNDVDVFLQLPTRDVHVFLDNLDDYYEMHPRLWKQSMYGQFRAVREISQAQRHVHLYTSIRADVFAQFRDEMRLQYFDYVCQLGYRPEDLLRIFEDRIALLDEDLLERPQLRDKDPWVAFLGDHACLHWSDDARPEPVSSLILRHSLGRPRDMIHMGTVLLAERRDGFTADSVRDAIVRASAVCLDQYLHEIEPLLSPHGLDVREFLLELVPGAVVDAETMGELELLYADWKQLDSTSGAAAHPFALLYELGLLGIQETDRKGHAVQHFRQPGQGLDTLRLPRSPRYFLHPAVCLAYAEHIGSACVATGHGLPVPTEVYAHG
ncbi:MAG: hypothetical protein KDK91_01835 [Gammaproteobacteria bacterium]|nr:hypothetical protein [Gammaproteobacteria bacterium]